MGRCGSASPANVPQPLLTTCDTIVSYLTATGYPTKEVVVDVSNKFGGNLGYCTDEIWVIFRLGPKTDEEVGG